MRTRSLIPAAAAAGLCSLLATAARAEIEWAPSYAEARKLAKERDCLIMIDFWAPW